MAASINNSVKASNNLASNSLASGSFSIGGSNRALYVFVATGSGSPADPTTVKWGGAGGTDLSKLNSVSISSFFRLTLWRLINPSAISSTIVANWAATHDERALIGVAVQNVNQTTPNRTVITGTALGALSISVNATSISGDLVLDGVWFGDINGQNLTFTPNSPQVSTQEIEGTELGFEGEGSSSKTATSTSTSMGWTLDTSPDNHPDFGMVAFALIESSQGAGYSHESEIVWIG